MRMGPCVTLVRVLGPISNSLSNSNSTSVHAVRTSNWMQFVAPATAASCTHVSPSRQKDRNNDNAVPDRNCIATGHSAVG